MEKLFEIQRIVIEQFEDKPFYWRSQFDPTFMHLFKALQRSIFNQGQGVNIYQYSSDLETYFNCKPP